MSSTSQQQAPTTSLKDSLRHYWGYDGFLPLQEEAMSCVMAGEDSIVVLPAGGGRSLCFQTPAVCLEGMAIVVSPLISLMKAKSIRCGPVAFPLRLSTARCPFMRNTRSRTRSGVAN